MARSSMRTTKLCARSQTLRFCCSAYWKLRSTSSVGRLAFCGSARQASYEMTERSSLGLNARADSYVPSLRTRISTLRPLCCGGAAAEGDALREAVVPAFGAICAVAMVAQHRAVDARRNPAPILCRLVIEISSCCEHFPNL